MRRSGIQRGFTLIELAAASAATAILMGAVLAILGGIVRDRQRLAQARPSEAADQAPVIELLRRDLACAGDLQIESNGDLVLDGNTSLDAKNLEVTDRPSRIVYRIVDEAGVRCLVREQNLSDEPVPPPPLKSLVALGVRSIQLQALPKQRQSRDDEQSGPSLKNKVTVIPSPIRLRLEFDDPAANIDRVLCLR